MLKIICIYVICICVKNVIKHVAIKMKIIIMYNILHVYQYQYYFSWIYVSYFILKSLSDLY